MGKVISRQDYYKLLGLGELAKQYVRGIDDVTAAIAEIVGKKDEGAGYYGHVSDCVFEEDPIFHLMPRLKIEVVDEEKK